MDAHFVRADLGIDLFDAVFVHDAVMYMTTQRDLRAAIETAFVHCRPGGAALTEHGGHGGDGRASSICRSSGIPVRGDDRYTVDYAYWCATAMDRRASCTTVTSRGCSHANDGCAPSRTRGSSREWYRSITRSSNPDVTKCSSPSVRRNARDQLAACNFARLPAT